MKLMDYILAGALSIIFLTGCGSHMTTYKSSVAVTSQQQSFLPTKETSYIDSLIEQLPQGSEVGLYIYNLTKDKPIFAYRANKLSRPASTMKLITTITTLSHEAGRKPFSTEVWYSGSIARDTLQGNIYIKGGMDPEFDDDAMNALVADVSKFPFKVLNGQIIGDASMKDSLYWGSGWMWDDAPYSYQPHLSPLMFHKGIVSISVEPDSLGGQAIVKTFPISNYYKIDNKTKCHSSESGDFSITRDFVHQSNIILISGNVNQKHSEEITLSDVQNFFLQTFTDRLEAKGITITKPYDCCYLPVINYQQAKLMASWNTPCDSIVRQMLKQSDNLNAEAMLYRLASINNKQPITASDGTKAINKLITELGWNADNYKLADGSGLSNYDYVSPELEVSFLRYASLQPAIYNLLYTSLPIAGIDGTLRHRMKGSPAEGNVHAKTGSYTAIYALAGYLKASNGDNIAFSIMNQNILDAKKAVSFQDSICKLLCK